MVKLSSNPTCVLSDADVITNEQAERIAKVLTKHLPGAGDVTEAGKILGVDANGDVSLVEDKTGSTYTAGTGLTLENGQFSVDNPMPGASGASQGDVLTVGASGPEWAAPSGGNYSAGNGIAISEQGAISAVGGTGITVTAGSTVQKTLTAHTQDYVPEWTSKVQHMVAYMSLLDSALVSDIQNGGIDVTLAYPFEQYASQNGATYNGYLDDWYDHKSSFKAYAAIVELQTITYSSGPTYWGGTANRLVLGEITSQWADQSAPYPTILANKVVNYNFSDVNSSLSTITLADVLANPGNYCLTVLFYDTYRNLNAFDDNDYHLTCAVRATISDAGDYTTGSYTAMAPSAITVTNPVPAYAAGDAGKVLKVNSGATGVEWGAVPQELPASLGTAGQVLTVNSGATGVEWATPSGGSGGVVMLDYEETDKNLFNAAVAAMTNGQPVFVKRSFGQTDALPAIPLVHKVVVEGGSETATELCFACTTVQNADNASITAKVVGFSLMRTATYNPETGRTTLSFNRTRIERALQFST